MDVENLVRFTTGQLEQQAQEIFRRRPDVPFAFPVNIELLIECKPDVSLAIHDNLVVAHSIEGYVCKQQVLGKRLEVRIDHAIFDGNRPRYYAVLAEEFAHIELHMALVHAVRTVEDFIALQRNPAWPQYERDAKRLSAAIRMPVGLLVAEAERVYPRLVDTHGFGDAGRAERLLRNTLAESFQVPPEEMQRRMMDWPCYLSNRLGMSIQAASERLLPITWSVRAVSPVSQQQFIEDGVDGRS